MAGTVAVLTRTPVLFVAVLTVISLAISLVPRWQAAAPLLTITPTPVAVGADVGVGAGRYRTVAQF
jgi:hypothetical protein